MWGTPYSSRTIRASLPATGAATWLDASVATARNSQAIFAIGCRGYTSLALPHGHLSDMKTLSGGGIWLTMCSAFGEISALLACSVYTTIVTNIHSSFHAA